MLAQLITRAHTLTELPGDLATWPAQGAWRYEDYLRLPDDVFSDFMITNSVLYAS
ncbi:MAG: hypothetical protein KDE19_05200 [Caldilineaceae bacterium]|nr:hypothetical protein [Caldilineaceae bacterium]